VAQIGEMSMNEYAPLGDDRDCDPVEPCTVFDWCVVHAGAEHVEDEYPEEEYNYEEWYVEIYGEFPEDFSQDEYDGDLYDEYMADCD